MELYLLYILHLKLIFVTIGRWGLKVKLTISIKKPIRITNLEQLKKS